MGSLKRCRCSNLCTHGASQVALLVKNLSADARGIRDRGSIPGLGRSPGGVNGNPLHYSWLENPMDRGAWQAAVHGITKSWTQLNRLSTCIHVEKYKRKGCCGFKHQMDSIQNLSPKVAYIWNSTMTKSLVTHSSFFRSLVFVGFVAVLVLLLSTHYLLN